MDVILTIDLLELNNKMWTLGPCTKALSEVYHRTGDFVERCCLEPGKHILTCHTGGRDLGWKGAHITIDGHIYCDDFISSMAMREVLIEGMYICNNIYSYLFDIYHPICIIVYIYHNYFSKAQIPMSIATDRVSTVGNDVTSSKYS